MYVRLDTLTCMIPCVEAEQNTKSSICLIYIGYIFRILNINPKYCTRAFESGAVPQGARSLLFHTHDISRKHFHVHAIGKPKAE